jgi:hypothetical protein
LQCRSVKHWTAFLFLAAEGMENAYCPWFSGGGHGKPGLGVLDCQRFEESQMAISSVVDQQIDDAKSRFGGVPA